MLPSDLKIRDRIQVEYREAGISGRFMGEIAILNEDRIHFAGNKYLGKNPKTGKWFLASEPVGRYLGKCPETGKWVLMSVPGAEIIAVRRL